MDEQYQPIIPGFEPLVPETPQLPPPKKPPAAPITEPGINQDDGFKPLVPEAPLATAENVHTTRYRGLLDIAICSVMRDGMLRRSEVLELQWQDFEVMEDGTSRLHIRHSQTEQERRGETVYLGEQATNDLLAIRRPAS